MARSKAQAAAGTRAALVTGVLLASATVSAEEFTGKTAAYVDWAVKNCDSKSCEQVHKLVEQVNSSAKDHDAFQHQYLAQFAAKEMEISDTEAKARFPSATA